MSIEPFKSQYYAYCDGKSCTKELPFENDYPSILKAIADAGWLIRISKTKREVLCKECRGGTK